MKQFYRPLLFMSNPFKGRSIIAPGKNTWLESLMLLDTSRSNGDWQPGWLNEKTISGLAEKLKKNHTLTELVLAPESHLSSPISRNYSVLQQVLDRNSALQRYACSDAFLRGAVEGFFATKSMPTDTVIATAKALMQYKPRTGAAALALVNKASYAQALFRRRQAHPDMLDKLLPITRNLLIDNRKTMIGLLNGIIVNRDDFSNDDFCRIADSRTLPAALVAIMLQSPPDYLYLIKLFCQAVGVAKIGRR